MKQTIEILDHLAAQIEQYLQEHPDVTLSDLIEAALEQKLTLISTEISTDEVSSLDDLSYPTAKQVEKFMALSGIVKDAALHSDEHAEDFVN